MDNPTVSERFSDPKSNFKKSTTLHYTQQTLNSSDGDLGFAGNDRRFAYSRQSSFGQFAEPRTPTTIVSTNYSRSQSQSQAAFSRSVSSIDIPPGIYSGGENDYSLWKDSGKSEENVSSVGLILSIFRVMRTGNRPMKRLFLLISLNVTYSIAELFIGLILGRVGLVSDAFHLTFGCGLLTFSLFAMAASRRKPDRVYTYGYKRLEVLSAFTNATAISSIHVIFLGCGSTTCIHTR